MSLYLKNILGTYPSNSFFSWLEVCCLYQCQDGLYSGPCTFKCIESIFSVSNHCSVISLISMSGEPRYSACETEFCHLALVLDTSSPLYDSCLVRFFYLNWWMSISSMKTLGCFWSIPIFLSVVNPNNMGLLVSTVWKVGLWTNYPSDNWWPWHHTAWLFSHHMPSDLFYHGCTLQENFLSSNSEGLISSCSHLMTLELLPFQYLSLHFICRDGPVHYLACL